MLVPPQPYFHRDRQRYRSFHLLHNERQQTGIFQEDGPGSLTHNLSDRATRVDVDQHGSLLFQPPRRFRHRLRPGAEKLNRGRRRVKWVHRTQVPGSAAVATDTLGTDHFCRDHAGPVFRHDPPVHPIRDAGHGSQDERRVNRKRSDAQWVRAKRIQSLPSIPVCRSF